MILIIDNYHSNDKLNLKTFFKVNVTEVVVVEERNIQDDEQVENNF